MRLPARSAAEIAARLEPLFALPETRLVVLFGSRARGDARDESDIDLGILSETDDFAALCDEATRLLATDRVDLVDLRRASPLLAMAVAREGVPLHEGRAGAFGSFASLAVRRYADTAKLRRLEARVLRDFAARVEAQSAE